MENTEALDVLLKANENSANQLFETMCPMPLTIKNTSVNGSSSEIKEHYEGVGVISITGGCKGSVSIHVPKTLGVKVAQVMLGLEEVNDTDLYDTIGEMANIVVGCAKTVASSSNLDFDISCPTVIRGDPCAIVEPPRGAQTAYIEMEVENMPLMVMMYLV